MSVVASRQPVLYVEATHLLTAGVCSVTVPAVQSAADASELVTSAAVADPDGRAAAPLPAQLCAAAPPESSAGRTLRERRSAAAAVAGAPAAHRAVIGYVLKVSRPFYFSFSRRNVK